MTASVTHLRTVAPQPSPSVPDATACFAKALYEAAIAEGERRVYQRLGIPQPVSAPSRHLSPVLSAGAP